MSNDVTKYLVCLSAGRCKHSPEPHAFFGLIVLCRGKPILLKFLFLSIEKSLARLEFEWVINDFYSHTSFQMKWKTITLVFQKNNIEIGALNG